MRKLLLAVLVLAACSDPVGPGDVRVVPERDVYPAFRNDEPVMVRYTVTNTGSARVELATCGLGVDATVQRLEAGEWVSAGKLTCLPSILRPIVVAPGASVTDSVLVTGFGTWRVRVPFAHRGDEMVADSRSFETRIPPD